MRAGSNGIPSPVFPILPLLHCVHIPEKPPYLLRIFRNNRFIQKTGGRLDVPIVTHSLLFKFFGVKGGESIGGKRYIISLYELRPEEHEIEKRSGE